MKRYPLKRMSLGNLNLIYLLESKGIPVRIDLTSLKPELVHSSVWIPATRPEVSSLKNLLLQWIGLRIKFRSNFPYKGKELMVTDFLFAKTHRLGGVQDPDQALMDLQPPGRVGLSAVWRFCVLRFPQHFKNESILWI